MKVESQNMEQEILLGKVREGDERFLENLYEEYREGFIFFAKKHFQAEEDIAAEVYQKSFIILYVNIKDGKLDHLTSSLRTYLFGIGKRVFSEEQKEKFNQMLPLEDEVIINEEIDTSILDRYDHEHQKEVVRRLLIRIGEPCKSVLELFYFKRYSVEAIAIEMNYKNERTLSKRKSLCLKQLRKLLIE